MEEQTRRGANGAAVVGVLSAIAIPIVWLVGMMHLPEHIRGWPIAVSALLAGVPSAILLFPLGATFFDRWYVIGLLAVCGQLIGSLIGWGLIGMEGPRGNEFLFLQLLSPIIPVGLAPFIGSRSALR